MPLSPVPQDVLRRRIIRRARKLYRESDQSIRDIAWWNENRTDAPPLDPEPFIVQRARALRVLKDFGASP